MKVLRAALLLLGTSPIAAFSLAPGVADSRFTGTLSSSSVSYSTTALSAERQSHTPSATSGGSAVGRRAFGQTVWGALGVGAFALTQTPASAQAEVFFDPAMYGDQELRVSAVDSVKERVRRAILKDPQLAPSFYELALLDALSYNANSKKYGPDGTVLTSVLSIKSPQDEYTRGLQQAALELVEAENFLRKKNAISMPDAIAIGGAEAIESIGGPVLTVQLGRMDTPKNAPINPALPVNLLSGECSKEQVIDAFRNAGVTDREMVALLTGLLTLEMVEKNRSTEDWRASAKPKYRERGKMGRMSDFKRLSEEDIAEAEAQAALEADPEYSDPDDGWYIADSFGTRESRFGERLGKEDIDEKSFNKYVRQIDNALKKNQRDTIAKMGWIAELITDTDKIPSSATLLTKYATTNLSYNKDLNVAYNSITKLGAVYTGGKYENLLKGKPRKSLNDDGLNLF